MKLEGELWTVQMRRMHHFNFQFSLEMSPCELSEIQLCAYSEAGRSNKSARIGL